MFISYRKDKPAIRGEVSQVWVERIYDLKNKVRIDKQLLRSTTGLVIETNLCYRVDKELSFDMIATIKSLFKWKKSLEDT